MLHIDAVINDRQSVYTGRRSVHLGHELIQLSFIAADILVIIGTALAVDASIGARLGIAGDLVRGSILVAAMFTAIVGMRGGYRLDVLPETRLRLGHAVTAWLIAFGALAGTVFLLKIADEFSRIQVGVFFVAGGAVVLASQLALTKALRRRLASGALTVARTFAIVVGDSLDMAETAARLRQRGTEIVGTHRVPLRHTAYGRDCRTVLEAARGGLARLGCDSVMVFAPWKAARQIEELTQTLADLPIPVVLMADMPTRRVLSRRRIDVGSYVGFEISRAPLSRADRAVKRIADVAIASLALVILSPLLVLTSLGILLESGRPIFFRQNRRGFGGREFKIWKFRSMTVQENGPNVPQAQRNDPRVTPLGRILRKTSIDELPQLINVLQGNMSIVGPRPHAIAHDNHYDDKIATYAFRQHVKPGITGWAQVNGLRGETRQLSDMTARVEHDLWYINNWSFWLDIRIIVRTALKAAIDKDAY
jgi:Undecaprenyl-phosphate glucose phosphotransferase